MFVWLGFAALAIAGALVIRVVGGVVSRPWPRAHEVVERYALWSFIPIIFVMLLVLSWPLAIAAVLLSPVIVYVVREYFRLYGVPRNAGR